MSRTYRQVASLLIGLLLVIGGSAPAAAAPGDLDPSFGDAGLVYTDFIGEAYGMALQTDGKIVTVGGHDYSSPSFALARFNVDGGLDPSFGDGGMLSTGFGGGQELCVQLLRLDDPEPRTPERQ